MPWSSWKPLPHSFTPGTLAELLDGGQSFRWNHQSDGTWQGAWGGCAARLRLDAQGTLLWSAPTPLADRVAVELLRYLGDDASLSAALNRLPWRSDRHLEECLKAFPGLRILRQPFSETLLCFLCSATKQILQIKQMAELLARRHGTQIAPDLFRLPDWAELASTTEMALRECQLGFRARYIHETARFLASHPGWLEETEAAPYATAHERLCTLPGVGAKVADCTLLFGAGRIEAFPVDVWILKTMARRYGMERWRPDQVAHFGRLHFGPAAGLAQQYLFAWERRAARQHLNGNHQG